MARLYKKGMRNIGIKVCLKVKRKTFNKQEKLASTKINKQKEAGIGPFV